MTDLQQKVTASHLKRNAYLYIRQSTLRQVFENAESTWRQYDLKQRAMALGWPSERIIIIDHDLGQSGASAADREGFKTLVTAVSLGHAGMVLGLEVSRLARNSTDWHRLLEICALSDTLILDEDGIYDPAHFNDRLLLGLKGTMSEAELHLLRARLQGGILNKARRGELALQPPIGLVYDAHRQLILDPDSQVQDSVRLLFSTFRRVGSACATVKAFQEQGVLFPRRLRSAPHHGELVWRPLGYSHVRNILHNPRYTGAFVFGQTRTRRKIDGKYRVKTVARDQWHVFLPDVGPAYISWQEYEDNQRRLRENAQSHGIDRRKSPPREGPALLQGLVICGHCGRRMTVHYGRRRNGERHCPEYTCTARADLQRTCPRVPGSRVDLAISDLLIESMSPVALDIALAVQEELRHRAEEANRLRRKQLERAQYEADLAQRRYLAVDPANRLVADSLETAWNQRLRAVADIRRDMDAQSRADAGALDDQQRAEIGALAGDFRSVWRDPNTSDRDRKRMIRLMIEDVTLLKGTEITMHIRFKGGATKTVRLTDWMGRRTPAGVIAEIQRLLDQHPDHEVAALLNERGFLSGDGHPFTREYIGRLRRQYSLKSRLERLRDAGMLTLREKARELGVTTRTVKKWRARGILEALACDRNTYVYPPIGPIK